MPNHVTTRSVVSGPKPTIERFKGRAFRLGPHEDKLDFNAFVAMPASIAATKTGTVAEEGAVLQPVFRTIAQEFPELSIRCSCFEEDGRFAGDGFFNPTRGQRPFRLCKPTDHVQVYGCEPSRIAVSA
jgi:hypothetical protein